MVRVRSLMSLYRELKQLAESLSLDTPVSLPPVVVTARAGAAGRVQLAVPPEPALRLRGVDPAHLQTAEQILAARQGLEQPVQNNLLKALKDVEQGAAKVGAVVSVIDDMRQAIVSLAGPKAEKFFGPFRVIAKLLAAFEIAEGIKSLAAGIWPPNPTALASAAQHFKAAQHFAQIGGGGASGGGGGGGGGAGAGVSASAAGAAGSNQGAGTIMLQLRGDHTMRTIFNDPENMDALAEALRELSGRQVQIVQN